MVYVLSSYNNMSRRSLPWQLQFVRHESFVARSTSHNEPGRLDIEKHGVQEITNPLSDILTSKPWSCAKLTLQRRKKQTLWRRVMMIFRNCCKGEKRVKENKYVSNSEVSEKITNKSDFASYPVGHGFDYRGDSKICSKCYRSSLKLIWLWYVKKV